MLQSSLKPNLKILTSVMRNQHQKNVVRLLKSWSIEFKIGIHDEFFVRGSKHRILLPPVNEDIAYLLGILSGDGCLKTPKPRRCGGNRFTIAIFMPNTIEGEAQAKRISELVSSNFNYELKIYKGIKIGKSWLDLRINSVVIYAYFYGLGLPIGRKYGKLRVPALVHGRLFKQFLHGLIDSDGHLAKSWLVIVQKDKRFLDEVRKLSSKFLGLEFTRLKPNVKKASGKIYKWYYIRSKTYFSSGVIEPCGPVAQPGGASDN